MPTQFKRGDRVILKASDNHHGILACFNQVFIIDRVGSIDYINSASINLGKDISFSCEMHPRDTWVGYDAWMELCTTPIPIGAQTHKPLSSGLEYYQDATNSNDKPKLKTTKEILEEQYYEDLVL